jgi:uncharacterized RDD family membrane protein YckC
MAALVDLLATCAISGVLYGLFALVTWHWTRHDVDLGMFVFATYLIAGSALVARKGWTPGKWMFELEVVDAATGQRPPLRRAVIRTLVPVALPLAGSIAKWGLQLSGHKGGLAETLSVVSGCAPPVALLWASLRSHGKLTIWDRLSGTLVRYRTRRTTAI